MLTAVALLVLLNQTILQPLLVQMNFSAPAINLAGRQRMLSQKITKEALALERTQDQPQRAIHRTELAASLEQWTAAHRALLHGDDERGVQPVDGAAANALRQVEPEQMAMQSAANEILRGPLGSDAKSAAAAQRILSHEPVYLRGMEQVVALLEDEAHRRVFWLRACGLFALLAILALVGGVCERSSRLSSANAALGREMTERQETQERMRSLQADLAHASRVTALGQLATGLAHEVNQPLATIANHAGSLELALDRTATGNHELHMLADEIKQAALRAGNIVRRMRNFVRRGEVQAAPVDLNVLVEEVCGLCRFELREAEVELELELAPGPVLAVADAVQVQQVIVNLIHNAIQAMADGPRRHLNIRTAQEKEEVTLTVSDTGPGLPAEILKRHFEPFRSSKRDGLGLGLAISRTIVEQHQGRIWSENRERGGAVVGFSLPRLPTHDRSSASTTHCLCR